MVKRVMMATALILGATSCDLNSLMAPRPDMTQVSHAGDFHVYVEVDSYDDSLVRHPYYLDGRGEEIDTSLYVKRQADWTRIRLAFDRHDPRPIQGASLVSALSRELQSTLPPFVIYNLPTRSATLDGEPVDLYVKVANQYVEATLEVIMHTADPAHPSPAPSGIPGGVLMDPSPDASPLGGTIGD